MKLFLAVLSIALFIAGCKSGKSTEETKPVITKDTVAATAPADTAGKEVSKDTVSAIEKDLDGVGGLTLGMIDSSVIKLLGKPGSKSKAQEWGADGLMHQDWFYKSRGITLNMDNSKGPGKQAVFSITITSPCDFKTNRNIGIGSTYSEVTTAYEKEIDKAASDVNDVVIGSVYGGIIVAFKNDKVIKIFIGAAAE